MSKRRKTRATPSKHVVLTTASEVMIASSTAKAPSLELPEWPSGDLVDEKHCDDYIQSFSAPKCLRFFLFVNRLPAIDLHLLYGFNVRPRLFASFLGVRVRVVMASRLGDVGITRDLDAETGYQGRVFVSQLADFGVHP